MSLQAKEQFIGQLLLQYENSVLRICYMMLGDRGMAEDALQDTFMKAWKNLATFEGRNDSSIRTWICRIAVNTCKDYKRTFWYKRIDRRQSVDVLLETAASDHDCYAMRDILLSVMQLPDRCKTPVLLHYYQGLTLQEIAKVLKISQPSVSRRIKKAIEILKKEVNN